MTEPLYGSNLGFEGIEYPTSEYRLFVRKDGTPVLQRQFRMMSECEVSGDEFNRITYCWRDVPTEVE